MCQNNQSYKDFKVATFNMPKEVKKNNIQKM
jgi:hypothetical protein